MCYSPEVALSFLPYETSVLGKLTTYQAEMERERRTETEGETRTDRQTPKNLFLKLLTVVLSEWKREGRDYHRSHSLFTF